MQVLNRAVGIALFNLQVKPRYRIRNPRKFYQFAWEGNVVVEVPTKQQWKELDKRYVRNKKPSK